MDPEDLSFENPIEAYHLGDNHKDHHQHGFKQSSRTIRHCCNDAEA